MPSFLLDGKSNMLFSVTCLKYHITTIWGPQKPHIFNQNHSSCPADISLEKVVRCHYIGQNSKLQIKNNINLLSKIFNESCISVGCTNMYLHVN